MSLAFCTDSDITYFMYSNNNVGDVMNSEEIPT